MVKMIIQKVWFHFVKYVTT